MGLIDELHLERVARGGGTAIAIKACTAEEIARLEHRLDLTLPPLFRDYLRLMGREPGNVAIGSDVRYGCLHQLTGELRGCAKEQGVVIPVDAFAMFAHQGYDYLYLLTGTDQIDPPVFRFHMAFDQPKEVFPSLSEYFRWFLAGGTIVPGFEDLMSSRTVS